MHLMNAKVEVIHEASTPKNKRELQTSLSFPNFYYSFLKDKAIVAEPLHHLLDNDATWKCTKCPDKSFNDVK